MTKKMLIDAAHPEEVRVAVLDNGKVEDFDFESASRKPLRGNIYLARVTRVEPSLQAAFVEYGGNRHGFLAFSEIHPDYYQIPVSDRQALQAAEAEVAELASQLELSSADDDDQDGEDDDAARRARKREENDDEDRHDDDDDDSDDAAASDEHDSAEDEDASDDQEEDANDPLNDIKDDPADEEDENGEEEEEEEEENDEAEGDSVAPVVAKAANENEEDEDDGQEAGDDDDDTAEDEAVSHDGEQQADSDSETEDASSEARAEDEDDVNDDDDSVDSEEEADEDAPESKRAKGKERAALFERYKEAKRKRSQLLRNYKIQEVIKRRQILLVQVVKEERGNKGAALTTYLSLAGRYCVLMPNTARGGGISRKIPHSADRKRLRRVVDSLDVPQGMGLIIRTAGAKRTKTEIKRDYDYLLRLWENIRSLTLKSVAPCLIYEEASLIKRAIRDLYDKDIGEVLVEGENGYREAKDFMKMLMPSHAKYVQPYKGSAPIFLKNGVEQQLDGMYQPTVRLKSGGYIVIHQTEALVAIDVNSGRATRERNIEQTALKTNIEAAYEAARQFRLRDLAGLIVLDFIDMEEPRNNRKVEKALKDAVKNDRARIQLGRISNFGLLEMSRQRRRSGIVDGTTQTCPTCLGAGAIRSSEMAALRILRALEGEAVSGKAGLLTVRASLDVTIYVLNHHRDWLKRIEDQHGVTIELIPDPDRAGDDYTLEKSGIPHERKEAALVIRADQTEMVEDDIEEAPVETAGEDGDERDGERKKRRRRRRRKDPVRDQAEARDAAETTAGEETPAGEAEEERETSEAQNSEDDQSPRRRRRGRRGGRRNRRNRTEADNAETQDGGAIEASASAGAKSVAEPGDASPETAAVADDSPANQIEAPVQEMGDETVSETVTEAADETPPAPVETTEAEPAQQAADTPAPNGRDHSTEPEAVAQPERQAKTDLADAPQPEISKPRKKGWWNRGRDN